MRPARYFFVIQLSNSRLVKIVSIFCLPSFSLYYLSYSFSVFHMTIFGYEIEGIKSAIHKFLDFFL